MIEGLSSLPRRRSATLLERLSPAVMWVEAWLGAGLVLVIFLLLLANAVSRGIGKPLIWTDELAVHLMVWLAFLGASLCIAARNHMAVGLLAERLGPTRRLRLAVLVDLLVLAFLLVMIWVIWRWLDLPGLMRAGWSGQALAAETFNFIYTDPTLTLGVRKIWFWMIIPLTALTSLLHGCAVLVADWTALQGRT